VNTPPIDWYSLTPAERNEMLARWRENAEERDLLGGACKALSEQLEQLTDIARRFVDAYPGGQAGALGNGAARRAHDEFREALVSLPDREDAKQQDQGGRQKPPVSGDEA
jgi:hypothetical protein